jgi:hypothetical protein
MRAETSTLRAGLYLEFLERVGERKRHIGGVIEVDVRSAVESVIDAIVLAAGDRDRDAGVHAPDGRRAVLNGRAGQGDQVGGSAAVEREIQNTLVFHHVAYTQFLGFNQRRVCLYLDGLGNIAHAEHHRDHRVAVNLKLNTRLHRGSESHAYGFQFVRARSQIGQCVSTVLIGYRGAFDAGIESGRGDFNTRYYCSRRVMRGAADLGDGLGEND